MSPCTVPFTIRNMSTHGRCVLSSWKVNISVLNWSISRLPFKISENKSSKRILNKVPCFNGLLEYIIFMFSLTLKPQWRVIDRYIWSSRCTPFKGVLKENIRFTNINVERKLPFLMSNLPVSDKTISNRSQFLTYVRDPQIYNVNSWVWPSMFTVWTSLNVNLQVLI